MKEYAASSPSEKAFKIIRIVFLSVVSALVMIPFLWMILTSLQSSSAAVLKRPMHLPFPPAFGNFIKIFSIEPFGIYTVNSLIVSISATFLQLMTALLASYAFSVLRFPGKRIAFMFVLAVLMMPTQVAIIPLYSIMTKLGWLDSYLGLIYRSRRMHMESSFFDSRCKVCRRIMSRLRRWKEPGI